MSAVTLEISLLEAANLTDLMVQFEDLLGEDAASDPAIARLVPDAYPDDPDAAREFRSLTQDDLLGRRLDDVRVVRHSLRHEGRQLAARELDRAQAEDVLVIPLDAGTSGAWLRTLAALRLVMAERLGIIDDEGYDDSDPRFGVYEWLGYRLEGVVQALAR
ncbi:DUF2017 family protein [Microbacterium sp. 179-B 1A2 NHS]|uniref:DUF2017 family protein n=1 Tax=Microbacterium sp. 179-B 1A2 NHS TaxID=3142383 RepID=UPI0039A1E43A